MLLGLSALSVLPINWPGVALLMLAVALFVLEAKFASHGILGVGGAVAMVLGAVMLVEGPLRKCASAGLRPSARTAVRADHHVPGHAGDARAQRTK